MAVDDSLIEKVHALSDLELAVLLCLISREHCLMSTPPDAIDDLIQELQLVQPLFIAKTQHLLIALSR